MRLMQRYRSRVNGVDMAVMITLQKIHDDDPHWDGWPGLLHSRGESPDYNKSFLLSDIIDSHGVKQALWAMQCVDKIYAQRFTIECAKVVIPEINDQATIDAILAAEQYINGSTSREDVVRLRSKSSAEYAVYTAASLSEDSYDASVSAILVVNAMLARAINSTITAAQASENRKKIAEQQASLLHKILN